MVYLLGAISLIFACVTGTFLEFQSRSAHMAMSNLPLAVLLPFVCWLVANTFLKRFAPRFSLTTTELRTLLSILWVGGAFIGYNWATQWVGTMVAPRYYASPENRWKELIFEHLPWWMYPSNFPGVTENLYNGLPTGTPLPWGAWLGPIFWTASAGVAMTAIGLGITAVFQKQWVSHERLTYPLAQVSLELTEGFDRRRGWPPFLCSWYFWGGFAIAALPVLVNMTEFWVPGWPRLEIYDGYHGPTGPRGGLVSRYLQRFSYRILPTVLGFTFLCDLNILFSIWSFYLVGQTALYGMNRVGFSVGLGGQEANPAQIAGLFAHGVMIGLVVWAIWIARGHLKQVLLQILRPPGREDETTVILSPRVAALVLSGGTFYMIFWLTAAGFSMTMAAVWLALFWASIFASMKYLAASGFAYLFPNWGTEIPKIWVGTAHIEDSTLVSMLVVNWRLLSGWRLPVALPHVEWLAGGGRRTGRLIFGCVLLGLVSAAVYTIWICYVMGGATFQTWSLLGAPRGMYNEIATVVSEGTERTVQDPEKILIWLLGIAVATVAILLQAWVPWWPIHPLGLMLMFDGYVRYYALCIFIVWLSKLLILSFGGIGLYRRVKPCCYGLIVGYVVAVGCSFLADAIWFPSGGHYVHGY
jgi:hypothetical protein